MNGAESNHDDTHLSPLRNVHLPQPHHCLRLITLSIYLLFDIKSGRERREKLLMIWFLLRFPAMRVSPATAVTLRLTEGEMEM